MHRGFTAVMARVAGLEAATPGQLLKLAGRTFVSTVGGAAGPLYGTAFLQAGEALGDHERFGPKLLGEGMRATIPLQARKGRASYLGPRSVGHQDPGATSTALMFAALEQAVLADRSQRFAGGARRPASGP